MVLLITKPSKIRCFLLKIHAKQSIPQLRLSFASIFWSVAWWSSNDNPPLQHEFSTKSIISVLSYIITSLMHLKSGHYINLYINNLLYVQTNNEPKCSKKCLQKKWLSITTIKKLKILQVHIIAPHPLPRARTHQETLKRNMEPRWNEPFPWPGSCKFSLQRFQVWNQHRTSI